MSATTPPNIVFILVDDMGYGDFSRFNDGLSRTPRLDALIDESLCFSQHYTASPVCNPSRAALMTGRYPHRTGSIDTLEWRGLERLALRETTLADVFKASDYVTGLIGKWHLGAFEPRYHPRRRGFHESVCFRGGMHDYYDWRIEFGDTVKRGDGTYLTDVWTDEACAFLERHRKQPFFLHVTYNAPHTPLQAPDDEIVPFAETGRFTPAVSTLYGMIHRMDTGVGRILDTLDRLGLADNTIVFFTSDNGPQFTGQGDQSLVRFNCHFNGCKGNVYEGGIRVPMLLRWPDGLPGGGREITDMVHFCDWFPTVLAMTGIDRPDDLLPIDGINVLPVIRGEADPCSRRFWQWNRYRPEITCNAAMRDGDWKLIRPVIDEAMRVFDIEHLKTSMYNPEYFIEHGVIADPEPLRPLPDPPRPELYNIADDPLERHNLTEKHPDRVRRMLADIETWFEAVEADRAAIDDQW